MKNQYVIDVKGLTKLFDGKPAVNGIDLNVKRGEIFGFLGPNGSGKTTTIRMLCGLLTPDAGEGHCFGYDVLTQSYDIKLHVGYMSQQFTLYDDLTIRENIEFIGSLYQIADRKQKIEKCIAQLGLEDRQNQLSGTLSGGWKQRLALAVALLHTPKLLLLDEPTAGVDPKARRDFWQQIHQLAHEGITVLVSTHYMDEAERCHRLAYILDGNLLITGTMQEIIKHAGLKTWLISGPDLGYISQQLEKKPGIEQIAAFGNALHISGQNEEALLAALTPWITNKQYQCRQIEPGLEDAFISLGAGGKCL